MKKVNLKSKHSKQEIVTPHVIRTLEEQKADDNPKEYSFYEEYHDSSSYIKSQDKRKTVKLQEQGEDRIYYLHNDVQKEIVVYHIDGGLIVEQKKGDNKCDYGIYTEDELLILVELKGSDYKKAIQQITNTTKVLGLDGVKKIKKLLARIVLSNGNAVPKITSSDLARLKQIIGRYNGGFEENYIAQKTKQFEETLSNIQ